MSVRSSLTFTPPCCMMARMDRIRCWFVPMRPVTPFMMMPMRLVSMVMVRGCGFFVLCSVNLKDVIAVGGDDPLQVFPLIHRPVLIREDFHFIKPIEAGGIGPALDLANGNASFAHEAAVVQQVSGGSLPVAHMEGGEAMRFASEFKLRFERIIPPDVIHIQGDPEVCRR